MLPGICTKNHNSQQLQNSIVFVLTVSLFQHSISLLQYFRYSILNSINNIIIIYISGKNIYNLKSFFFSTLDLTANKHHVHARTHIQHTHVHTLRQFILHSAGHHRHPSLPKKNSWLKTTSCYLYYSYIIYVTGSTQHMQHMAHSARYKS